MNEIRSSGCGGRTVTCLDLFFVFFCFFPLSRELEQRFAVSDVPRVVVLKPNGEVIVGNAVEEISRLGPACFRNWQEAAELVDRNFLLAEDFDDWVRRSITDPLRRLKYKVDKRTEAKDEERKGEDEEAS